MMKIKKFFYETSSFFTFSRRKHCYAISIVYMQFKLNNKEKIIKKFIIWIFFMLLESVIILIKLNLKKLT